MANMSYCAFENTYSDLRQCLNMLFEARDNGVGLQKFIESRSSKDEGRAVEQLLALAEELIEVAGLMEAADEEEDEAPEGWPSDDDSWGKLEEGG
jgi:hypothetical protein